MESISLPKKGGESRRNRDRECCPQKDVDNEHGSACSPVTVTVFKTGGRQVFLSPVGSTPTRFRHFSTTFRRANHSQISLASTGPSTAGG